LHSTFTWSSVAAGLASAALWYRAATVGVTSRHFGAMRNSAAIEA
jgi:hypothetical protein